MEHTNCDVTYVRTLYRSGRNELYNYIQEAFTEHKAQYRKPKTGLDGMLTSVRRLDLLLWFARNCMRHNYDC